MRDAEQLEPGGHGWRRCLPRHPAMWVRVGGRWRKGWVQTWYFDDDGGRFAWATYDDGTAWGKWALFRYEPETMRPRDGDEPPAG